MNKTISYLIALVALLLTGLGSSAQSGATPYLNSTHTYNSAKSTVLTGTTLVWSLSEGGTLTEIKGANLSATVLWTAIGVHTVTVTETTLDGCSTKRDFPVTVTSNIFDLTITAPGIACAAGSGTVIANGALSPGNTTVVFTVAVAGNIGKTSTFDYALTSISTAVISSVTINNGIYSGPLVTGDNLTIPVSVNTFTVSVVIASRFDTIDDLKLTISDGKDFYGTPENNALDNTGTATVNAVPNTSSITTD